MSRMSGFGREFPDVTNSNSALFLFPQFMIFSLPLSLHRVAVLSGLLDQEVLVPLPVVDWFLGVLLQPVHYFQTKREHSPIGDLKFLNVIVLGQQFHMESSRSVMAFLH